MDSAPDLSILTDPVAHADGRADRLWPWMRRHAPVHWHDAGSYPGFWSVVRYSDVRAVYLDHETFSSAKGVMLRPLALGDDPAGGAALALTDPPRHGDIRALVGDLFAGRAVRALEEDLRKSTRAVLDQAVEAGTCDFAHDVAARLTITVICALLGVPEADRDQVRRWIDASFAAGRPLATNHEFMGYLLQLMDERTVSPSNDIVSRLVHGEVAGAPLSDLEILFNCENIAGAAENSGLSMATGMLAFIDNPVQWQLLVDHRELLPGAAGEMMRWASSATHSMRTATTAGRIGDQAIRPGDRVVVWLRSANRDEAVFADPDVFDIARRPNRHLAFGAGAHACIGAALARIQTTVLLSEILESGIRFESAGAPTPLPSIVVGGQKHLPMRLWRTA
ncbi:cytochrome P450 [Actinoplanes sp. NPDC049599]|uniref:cytochrome P450 n=1 Tax=Actinoplanes sp. NPDC049599 TaxID=3363903 RepID=UPI00379285FC